MDEWNNHFWSRWKFDVLLHFYRKILSGLKLLLHHGKWSDNQLPWESIDLKWALRRTHYKKTRNIKICTSFSLKINSDSGNYPRFPRPCVRSIIESFYVCEIWKFCTFGVLTPNDCDGTTYSRQCYNSKQQQLRFKHFFLNWN